MANICGKCDRSYYSASIRGCGGCDEDDEVDDAIEMCDTCAHSALARKCAVTPVSDKCSTCPNSDVCDVHCIDCKGNNNYKDEASND
jgi:hypothetical protein